MSKNKENILSLTRKYFEIQAFQSGEPGGQHQNKTNSGVRIIHRDSGAVGESREFKSQKQNKDAAFKRLTNSDKFNIWVKKQTAKNSDVNEIVGEMMKPQFIKTEYL